jgi:hypothetical protein
MTRKRSAPHRVAWLITIGVIAPIAAGAVDLEASASVQPVAHTAKQCSVPNYPGQGYFTSLSVSGTSCHTGRKLVLAYYRCRSRHGSTGTCHSKVLGYTCHEKRNAIPTEIDARVTCHRGGATVVHTYQQNT